jgi:hypothetical protein
VLGLTQGEANTYNTGQMFNIETETTSIKIDITSNIDRLDEKSSQLFYKKIELTNLLDFVSKHSNKNEAQMEMEQSLKITYGESISKLQDELNSLAVELINTMASGEQKDLLNKSDWYQQAMKDIV